MALRPYDPVGAMGGLFAPALIRGNRESEIAFDEWMARNLKRPPAPDAPPAPPAPTMEGAPPESAEEAAARQRDAIARTIMMLQGGDQGSGGIDTTAPLDPSFDPSPHTGPPSLSASPTPPPIDVDNTPPGAPPGTTQTSAPVVSAPVTAAPETTAPPGQPSISTQQAALEDAHSQANQANQTAQSQYASGMPATPGGRGDTVTQAVNNALTDIGKTNMDTYGVPLGQDPAPQVQSERDVAAQYGTPSAVAPVAAPEAPAAPGAPSGKGGIGSDSVAAAVAAAAAAAAASSPAGAKGGIGSDAMAAPGQAAIGSSPAGSKGGIGSDSVAAPAPGTSPTAMGSLFGFDTYGFGQQMAPDVFGLTPMTDQDATTSVGFGPGPSTAGMQIGVDMGAPNMGAVTDVTGTTNADINVAVDNALGSPSIDVTDAYGGGYMSGLDVAVDNSTGVELGEGGSYGGGYGGPGGGYGSGPGGTGPGGIGSDAAASAAAAAAADAQADAGTLGGYGSDAW